VDNVDGAIEAISFCVLNCWQINLATAFDGGCPKAQLAMMRSYEKRLLSFLIL